MSAKPEAGTAPEDALRDLERALTRGEAHLVSDAVLQRLFVAAVKAYAAKVEKTGEEPRVFAEHSITATEAVTVACAMIRAVDLNMFDVAIWFSRAQPGKRSEG